jgi:hypothetical protein
MYFETINVQCAERLAERLTEAYIEFIRKQARPVARTKAVATALSSRR